MTRSLERPKPPYQQIADILREQIRSGELAAGARLPGTRDIAGEYEVAFTTVSKALRVLAAEGLVETSNQGTMVTTGEPLA